MNIKRIFVKIGQKMFFEFLKGLHGGSLASVPTGLRSNERVLLLTLLGDFSLCDGLVWSDRGGPAICELC